DFIVAPTGGTGAGTLADPWSLAYAIGIGAGSARGDGKLPSTGAQVGLRGGLYTRTNQNWTFEASGALGSGVDNLDGKLIYRNYQGEHAIIEEVAAGATSSWRDNVILQ